MAYSNATERDSCSTSIKALLQEEKFILDYSRSKAHAMLRRETSSCEPQDCKVLR